MNSQILFDIKIYTTKKRSQFKYQKVEDLLIIDSKDMGCDDYKINFSFHLCISYMS
jgi:hypothetical protein